MADVKAPPSPTPTVDFDNVPDERVADWVVRCFPASVRKRACTPPWVLCVVCLYALVQSMVVTGLIGSVLTTWERRYSLTSTQAGLLPSVVDFGVLLFSFYVAYAGATGHKPRMLATGLAGISVGAIFMVIPQMYGSTYSASLPPSQILCGSGFPALNCSETNQDAYIFLVVGAAILALGGTPIWTLGTAYMDEIAPAAQLSTYLGVLFAVGAVGPALGFLIGGAVLDTWVDPGVSPPAGLTPESPSWVGAWWIAFVLASGMGILFVPFLCAYPKLVPGTQRRRANELVAGQSWALAAEDEIAAASAPERSTSTGSGGGGGGGAKPANVANSDAAALVGNGGAATPAPAVVDLVDQLSAADACAAAAKLSAMDAREKPKFWESFRACASNLAFMMISMGQALDGFTITGFAVFLPKVVQNMYSVKASDASFSVGLVVVPGAAGGILLGGYLVERLKLTTRGAARFAFIMPLISMGILTALLIGCPSNPLAGVNVAYNPNNHQNEINVFRPFALENSCNTGCGCETPAYTPVCGSDGITYFNACYAGCSNRTYASDGSSVYSSCRCAAADPSAGTTPSELRTLTATEGKCDVGCHQLPTFLGLLFLAMVFTFANGPAATLIELRTLAPQYRSFGQGMANVLLRIFGSIPGPLLFGVAIDSVCVIWNDNCGRRGDCYEYDNWQIRLRFLYLAYIPKGLAVITYAICWYKIPETKYVAPPSPVNATTNNGTAAAGTAAPKPNGDGTAGAAGTGTGTTPLMTRQTSGEPPSPLPVDVELANRTNPSPPAAAPLPMPATGGVPPTSLSLNLAVAAAPVAAAGGEPLSAGGRARAASSANRVLVAAPRMSGTTPRNTSIGNIVPPTAAAAAAASNGRGSPRNPSPVNVPAATAPATAAPAPASTPTNSGGGIPRVPTLPPAALFAKPAALVLTPATGTGSGGTTPLGRTALTIPPPLSPASGVPPSPNGSGPLLAPINLISKSKRRPSRVTSAGGTGAKLPAVSSPTSAGTAPATGGGAASTTVSSANSSISITAAAATAITSPPAIAPVPIRNGFVAAPAPAAPTVSSGTPRSATGTGTGSGSGRRGDRESGTSTPTPTFMSSTPGGFGGVRNGSTPSASTLTISAVRPSISIATGTAVGNTPLTAGSTGGGSGLLRPATAPGGGVESDSLRLNMPDELPSVAEAH